MHHNGANGLKLALTTCSEPVFFDILLKIVNRDTETISLPIISLPHNQSPFTMKDNEMIRKFTSKTSMAALLFTSALALSSPATAQEAVSDAVSGALSGWSGTASLGASSTTGNSQSSNVNASLRIAKKNYATFFLHNLGRRRQPKLTSG